MKISDRTRHLLIAIGALVAIYLAYRWYENRQSNSSLGLGTNLNSLPSALVAGSTGPMSGLEYYAGATNVYVSEPITQTSSSTTTASSTTTNPKPPIVPPFHWSR